MAACQFGSPALVTSLSGVAAAPTFAFSAANTNYLGIAGSFTANNGAVCSFPTQYAAQQATSTYAITPIIVNAGRTTTCSILAPASIGPVAGASTTYSGFECPSVTGRSMAPGTYTLRFNKPNVGGVPDIASRVFVVASPTFSTDVVTSTVFPGTSGITQIPIITTTSNIVTTTQIGPIQTVTQTVTGSSTTTTSTIIDLPSSCAPPTASPPPSTPSSTAPVSSDGQCGAPLGQTCAGSVFGACCSLYGWCGSSNTHCLTTEGCQPGFGDCVVPSSVSTAPPAPTPTDKISRDGTCGGENGYTCPGSGLGDCCSPYGWCGDTPSHCGAGCQVPFGTCLSPTGTGTAPLPTSTDKVSLDGTCGGAAAQTCLGSAFGDCCSEYGYCGATDVYCAAGCQVAFGSCGGTSPSPSPSPSPASAAAILHRAAPKANLRAAPYASSQRAAAAAEKKREKRAIGGAGPDFTYPPVPRVTVTSTVTQGQVTTGLPDGPTTRTETVIVPGGTVTATATVGGVTTVTVTVRASATGCAV